MLNTRAPAKVNLTLHVLGRRADGYHELESLVVFAGAADRLSLVPGDDLSLTVEGATAGDAGPIDDNLVIRAARALAQRRPGLQLGAFHLVKSLPAAAGIGGGSSDAASALRLLAKANGFGVDDAAVREAAAAIGADIPVCLQPCARMMRGAGEHVGPHVALPPLFSVLVNPRVAVPTAGVFKALAITPGTTRAGAAHPVMPDSAITPDALFALLDETRNDLEAPAMSLTPAIGEALGLLRDTSGCRLARMSGSGATVFGLYPDCSSAARAARAIRTQRPAWWVKPTVLR